MLFVVGLKGALYVAFIFRDFVLEMFEIHLDFLF